MTRIRRGTIIGLYRGKERGMALLGIEDDRRGQVLIPCDGNPTCRVRLTRSLVHSEV